MRNTNRISTGFFAMTLVFALITAALFVTGHTGAGIVYLPGTSFTALLACAIRAVENKKRKNVQNTSDR